MRAGRLRSIVPGVVVAAFLAVVPAQASALQIDSGPAEGSTVKTTSVTFDVSTNPATPFFTYRFDDGPTQFFELSEWQYNASFVQNDLTDGPHRFEVSSFVFTGGPGMGNTETITRNFKVDTSPTSDPDRTAPDTAITKPPAAKVRARKSAKVAVEFASTEMGSTFTCAVDDGAAQACTSPASFKLRRGKHTIAVAATDSAGNTDASPATVQVEVKKKQKRHRG